MGVKHKATPSLTPIVSKPPRELNAPRHMNTRHVSVSQEPGGSLELRPMAVMDGQREDFHVSLNHFPAGSRVVMLTVLVIAPDAPHEVICEREGSKHMGVDPAARQDGVKATLKATGIPSRYVYGPLVVDTSRYEVHANGHEIKLTPKEFGLLVYFLKNPGRVGTRDVILNSVWGYDYYGTTRTVDVHVRWLKQKIPLLVPAIASIHSLGYKLRANPGSDDL